VKIFAGGFNKLFTNDYSLKDIQNHLYMWEKISNGLKDTEDGRVYTQEEVDRMTAKWFGEHMI